MKIRLVGSVAMTSLLLATSAVSAHESSLRLANPGNDQQARQQEDVRERERAVAAPTVRSRMASSSNFPVLPVETACFRIERIALNVPDALSTAVKSHGALALPQDRFAFAREWLEHYAGACIGKQGIDVLAKGLSQQILSRGYVTTRVLLPEQDLSTGTLKLALLPGVIGGVRFTDESLRGTWKTAFPTSDGELLNLRDLEQGLEQMKREPGCLDENRPGQRPGRERRRA
jgi:hemolysin activation/secretion protein